MRRHTIVLAVFAGTVLFVAPISLLWYGSYHAAERAVVRHSLSHSGATVPRDYTDRVERIAVRIHDGDYGIGYASWNRLMVYRFFAASIGSITRTYPQDRTFALRARELLRMVYQTVDSEVVRSDFSTVGVHVPPYGIIYQAGRIEILAELARIDPEEYQDMFFSACDTLASVLRSSSRFTAESYPWWGWYVDNADAYHALQIADGMRSEKGQSPQYAGLIHAWTGELAIHTGATGLTLAEAYRPWGDDTRDQVRASATGWLLWDLFLIDPDFARRFFTAFDREFVDSFGDYTLIRDVARSEPTINDVPDGPHLWPYSSAGTILSVPIFRALGHDRDADGLLRSFDVFFIAPSPHAVHPDWLFGESLLLDVLRLWAEVAIPDSI